MIDGLRPGSGQQWLDGLASTGWAGGRPSPGGAVQPAEVAARFGEALTAALARVDRAQHQVDRASVDFATGENQDVAALMVASERASLAMELTLQIRNKVLEAYQEIIRMPL